MVNTISVTYARIVMGRFDIKRSNIQQLPYILIGCIFIKPHFVHISNWVIAYFGVVAKLNSCVRFNMTNDIDILWEPRSTREIKVII